MLLNVKCTLTVNRWLPHHVITLGVKSIGSTHIHPVILHFMQDPYVVLAVHLYISEKSWWLYQPTSKTFSFFFYISIDESPTSASFPLFSQSSLCSFVTSHLVWNNDNNQLLKWKTLMMGSSVNFLLLSCCAFGNSYLKCIKFQFHEKQELNLKNKTKSDTNVSAASS